MQIPWDTVELTIKESETLSIESVRVHVQAVLSISPEQADRSEQELAQVLRSVIDDRWEISSVLRREDEAGMERITALATIRVPERQAVGLVSKLQKASRSGLKLELKSVSYKAPAKELDAAFRRLRERVYARSLEEAKLLNEAMSEPARPWQVGKVTLTQTTEHDQGFRQASERVQRMTSAYSRDPFEPDDADDRMAVSNRVHVEAQVQLRRPAVPAPEGGFFALRERDD